MKKDPSFDEYKTILESEPTPLPESLREENIVQMLDEANPKQDKKKIKLFPRIAAVAAAAAVAITCVQMIPWQKTVHTTPVEPAEIETVNTTPLSVSKSAPLSQFDSDADLKAYFKNIAEKRKADDRFDAVFNGVRMKSASGFAVDYEYGVAADSVTMAAAPNAAETPAQATGNYGKTNTRTEDVDEGDIVKNDGRYLYTASRGKFSIIDTQTMQCVFRGEPKPEKEDQWYQFSSLYVQGDRLIVGGLLYTGSTPYDDADSTEKVYYGASVADRIVDYPYYYGFLESCAVTLVYDIADRSKPALLRAAVQDGNMESSRLVDDILYTVTTYSVYPDADKKSRLVPKVNDKEISCRDIYVRDPKGDCTTYIVLTALDTANPQRDIEKVSLLGNSDFIYCTTDTLYVLSGNYTWSEKDESRSTEIYAFSLGSGKPALQATGTVPGIVEDHYAVDQYKGCLRVTSTDYDYAKDVDISALYVLDGKLEIVGKLKDFARDEQVKSTRFLGDLAYVVTFRNTDPLFAIDLSDPKNPTILGAVKLPGFSEYLHPLSETLLLGVGYSGDDWNANYDSVKLSLFDISDPTAPKEIDTHVVKDATTDVNFDPKAFVFDSERGIFGLPMSYRTYGNDGYWHGTKNIYKTFTVKDGKFTEKKAYIADDSVSYYRESFFRGTYIGDKVYTLTSFDIQEFDMASCEKLRNVVYDKELAEKERYYAQEDVTETVNEELFETTEAPEEAETMPFDAESTVAPTLIEEGTTEVIES